MRWGLGIVVVLVLVLLYALVREPKWATLPFWQCHLSKDPEYVLEFSNGTYDSAAAIAYRKTLRDFNEHMRAADGVRLKRIAEHYMQPAEREEHREEVDEVVDRTLQIIPTDDDDDPLVRIALMNSLEYMGVDVAATREAVLRDLPERLPITEVKQVTDDPESVHDPTVNACNKVILERIKDCAAGHTIDDMKKYFTDNMAQLTIDPHTGQPRKQMLDKVLRVLNTPDSVIYALGVPLHTVIRCVWGRVHDPRNAENASALKQAVFDQLYDCYKLGLGGEQTRCSHGIATTVLGALAPLDFDESNSVVLRREMIRNEIYDLIQQHVEETAKRVAEGTDSKAAAVAKSYLGELSDLDPEAEDAFNAQLRTELHALITRKTAEYNEIPGAAPPEFAQMLRKEIDVIYG